jgi:hypothetical protein
MLTRLWLCLLAALMRCDDVISLFAAKMKSMQAPASHAQTLSHRNPYIHGLYAANVISGASDSESFTGLRRASDRDIPRIAELLSYALYTPTDQTVS